MKKGFLILSVLFLVTWLIGYFIFNASMPIHLCLAVALLLFIQSIITMDGARLENETKASY
jgi:hypothetical protein